jgi:hypothetical protein
MHAGRNVQAWLRAVVLNHLLLNRLAIAHVATEVRGSIAIQTRLTITPAGLREIGGDADGYPP